MPNEVLRPTDPTTGRKHEEWY